MQMSKRLLIISLILSATFCSVALSNVFAQTVPMTDQQVELIRNGCTSTKSTLNQLHSSDALLRVNIGQIYESMSAKLMENFNSRVALNNYDGVSLVVATTSYQQLLDSFRTDYMIYEKQLSSAISIDCSSQPVSFYDAVALAKIKRELVHNDVIALNQSLDQYNLVLGQFENDNQIKLRGIK